MTKDLAPRCALIIIAGGFDEPETIVWLSALRQAGLCAKSVGLTGGLISGAHGIGLRPDLTFVDLDHLLKTTTISLVILPGGEQGLAGLERDPRVYKLLRQAVAQGGQIVTGPEGLQIPRTAAVWNNGSGQTVDDQKGPVLLRDPAEPLEAFVQNLIRRLR